MIRHQDIEGQVSPDRTDEVILVQSPHLSPIYALLIAAGTLAMTPTQEFQWYTDAHAPRRTQIDNGGTAYTNATTDLVVDATTANRFYPGCLILAEATGEVMYCRAINTGTHTITVVRGVGSVIAASAPSVANDVFLANIGSAEAEGAPAAADRYVAKTRVSNYVQTFEQSIELSWRVNDTTMDTQAERLIQRAKKLQEAQQDIEQSMIYGAADFDTTDATGRRVTSTAGLRQAITTNVTNQGGTLSMTQFDQFCIERAFALGSGTTKVMACGATVLRTIHTLYKGLYRVVNGERAVGLRMTEVITPKGVLMVVPHDGIATGSALIVDPAQARLRYHGADGRLRLEENVHNNGDKAVKDRWIATLGLEYGTEQAHAWLNGVTGPA
jgi:hypothetical protein